MASKQVKHLSEWVDSTGYSWQAWLSGDWCQPLHMISKLISEEIKERQSNETNGSRISFEDMWILAEELLGMPQLFIEGDISLKQPNLYVALLTMVVQLKYLADYIPTDQLKRKEVPLLSFVLNSANSMLKACPACSTGVPIFDRIIVDGSSVFHRPCFLCVTCGKRLRKGTFKKSKNGFECFQHSARRILDQRDDSRMSMRLERPRVAPPPAPSPVPSPKPRTSVKPPLMPKPYLDNSSQSSATSADSGIVLRPNLEQDTKSAYSEENGPPPVPPPRTKRASVLLNAERTPPISPSFSRNSSVSGCPTPKPRKTLASISDLPTNKNEIEIYPNNLCPFSEEEPKEIRRSSSSVSLVDYPSYLCPFGDEDGGAFIKTDEYDESKNPFADSDEDDEASCEVSSKKQVNSNEDVGQPLSVGIVPPPKPARISSLTDCESNLSTIRVSRKQIRAPLPPSPKKRMIGFTERGVSESADELLLKLDDLDCRFEKLATIGRALEDDLHMIIIQNQSSWLKNAKFGEWIQNIQQLLDLFKEEATIVYRWREAYLNDVHSETEHHIRILLDKEVKSDWELLREATLTNLLVAIIDEKSKLSESAEADADAMPRESLLHEKNEKTKNKLKKRISLLKNKIRGKKD